MVCSVCDFLLFLGKLMIVLVCGVVSYLSFGGYIPEIKVQLLPASQDSSCSFMSIGEYH
jgi:hypothetical protein